MNSDWSTAGHMSDSPREHELHGRRLRERVRPPLRRRRHDGNVSDDDDDDGDDDDDDGADDDDADDADADADADDDDAAAAAAADDDDDDDDDKIKRQAPYCSVDGFFDVIIVLQAQSEQSHLRVSAFRHEPLVSILVQAELPLRHHGEGGRQHTTPAEGGVQTGAIDGLIDFDRSIDEY